MNKKELDEYYLLEESIRDLDERIRRLEAKLCASPRLDKIGSSGSSGKNSTEEKYIAIIHEKERLRKKREELKALKSSIEKYIDGIDDLLASQIAKKRIYENKQFRQIALELGGNNTEDSVKKIYYRRIVRNHRSSGS